MLYQAVVFAKRADWTGGFPSLLIWSRNLAEVRFLNDAPGITQRLDGGCSGGGFDNNMHFLSLLLSF